MIRERDIRRQLLLGDKTTLGEALYLEAAVI
jgi:hypothetical protein